MKTHDQELLDATWTKDLFYMKEALAAGADPNAREPSGLSALQRVSMMEPAWDRYGELDGNTIVAFARALLEAGANPNALGPNGSTPIREAEARQNEALVRLLISHGAIKDLGNALVVGAGGTEAGESA